MVRLTLNRTRSSSGSCSVAAAAAFTDVRGLAACLAGPVASAAAPATQTSNLIILSIANLPQLAPTRADDLLQAWIDCSWAGSGTNRRTRTASLRVVLQVYNWRYTKWRALSALALRVLACKPSWLCQRAYCAASIITIRFEHVRIAKSTRAKQCDRDQRQIAASQSSKLLQRAFVSESTIFTRRASKSSHRCK